MSDVPIMPQSGAPCQESIDALTFPPGGDLTKASLTSLLLHALTGGEGDPLEEMLAALGRRVSGYVDSPPSGAELYSVERSVAAMAEIRRRQVERAGGGCAISKDDAPVV